jgi:hypothetical protein
MPSARAAGEHMCVFVLLQDAKYHLQRSVRVLG